MTPQLYVKLSSQIARQTPEAEALEAQALALQPGIDSAQAWLDSCQASYNSATVALKATQADEGADKPREKRVLDGCLGVEVHVHDCASSPRGSVCDRLPGFYQRLLQIGVHQHRKRRLVARR